MNSLFQGVYVASSEALTLSSSDKKINEHCEFATFCDVSAVIDVAVATLSPSFPGGN